MGAALLDGGVGVAAAEVGVLAPPDDDPPVVMVVVLAAVVAAAAAPSVASEAAGAAAAAPKLKLGTNSIAFTFRVENLVATSEESLSWAILLLTLL